MALSECSRTTREQGARQPKQFRRGFKLYRLTQPARGTAQSPLSFGVAIRRMGGFVSVVLAHSMQGLFYGGCSRSTGLQMEQLREFE